jgi:mono/diheme cytochrome c family protein
MFRRVVNLVQVLVAVATLGTVVLLGAAGPAATTTGATVGGGVFAASCAGCHGADGKGGVGPDLTSGSVFERFAGRAEMIEFVTTGSGRMPEFGERLSVGEIGAVVDFVRNDLARP